jgi:superfamily II DNA or RNA helicase
MFTELKFSQTFWKYQQMILEVVEEQTKTDTKFHLVSPPGSGKTIVGLELVARFGKPAVIFTPTTTIQKQWQEKLALFAPDTTWLNQHSSLDAKELSDINMLTYQVLSTPGENLDFIEKIAIDEWKQDLMVGEIVGDAEQAAARIELIKSQNKSKFKKEISKRYHRIKRKMLADPTINRRQFLHENAVALIDRIVALGVETVVLDECHHLLDYWAFILHELLDSLPNVKVIGLTATLPDPENDQAYDNYTSLLGEVDFEIPTPAVVKEGNLAPYRDLVYFCEPSAREQEYLDNIQSYFEQSLQPIINSLHFQQWMWRTVVLRQKNIPVVEAQAALDHVSDKDVIDENLSAVLDQSVETNTADEITDQPAEIEVEPFADFYHRKPDFCTSALKYFLLQEKELPEDIILVEEAREKMALHDWIRLIEEYSLKELVLNDTPENRNIQKTIRKMLLNYGIHISEKGARHLRAPGEMVLSMSESKDEAAIRILSLEHAHMGDKLRAMVITDFEQMSTIGARLKGVLDPDAGSAVRVFRSLIGNEKTNLIDPVLVTGKVVLVDEDCQSKMEDFLHQWKDEHRLSIEWQWRTTDDDRILQLQGAGKGWSTRSYVSMITSLFEQGVTKCLVGTRGIFGEGWDSTSLNTLVNLTTVATSTSIRQIRGRSLRIDPTWPRKVAHNWDIVCYSPRYEQGTSDFERFLRKHKHTWGIVLYPNELEKHPEGVSQKTVFVNVNHEQIVKSVRHVSPFIYRDFLTHGMKKFPFKAYNDGMLAAIQQRDAVYDAWHVGDPYSNFNYHATTLNGRDMKFRSVADVGLSIRGLIRRLMQTLLFSAAFSFQIGIRILGRISEAGGKTFQPVLFFILVFCFVVFALLSAADLVKFFKDVFLKIPLDAVVYDIAHALLDALRECKLISRNLNEKYIRVFEDPNGMMEVFLDYASPEDSDTFARAFQEILGPITNARYLVERDSSGLANVLYVPLWVFIRTIIGQSKDARAYHKVPDILACQKKRAEIFAKYWKKYVGGGRLLYTHDSEGRQLVLEARGKVKHDVRNLAFEVWK